MIEVRKLAWVVWAMALVAGGCSQQSSAPAEGGRGPEAGLRADAGGVKASPSADAGAVADSGSGAGEGGAVPDAGDRGGEEDATAAEPALERPTEYPLHAVALFHHVNIYAEPNSRSDRVGVLRRGTRVRIARAHEGRGCREGQWHAIQPRGYVCSGRTMRVGEEPPPLVFSPTPAKIDSYLPYDYGRNRLEGAPLYRRPPTSAQYAAELERRRAELEAKRAAAAGPPDGGAPPAEEPEEEVEEPEDEEEEEEEGEDPALGPIKTRLKRGYYVTVERIILENGRRWVRTSGLNYVEARAIFRQRVSEIHGAELGDQLTLPVVIVSRDLRSRRVGPGGKIGPGREIERFTALPLLGETRLGAEQYYSVGGGELVAADRVKRIDPMDPPPEVGPEERWIEVDLSEQTLVAYEGSRPVYATLVSTGKRGHETPTGSFRITSKFVSTDMSDTTDGDEPYLIEDVPWTMYFNLAIALHGAFWHTRFGRERSHGCVNLAPADARWLFWWVGPELPEGWHGVASTDDNPGTRVVVHE